MKWSIRVHDFLTTIKVIVLAVFAISGLVVLSGFTSIPNTNNFSQPFANISTNPQSYAQAMFSIFWGYDGWNNLNYATGELKDPIRNLPIAASGGVTIVTVLYILANIAYFVVVPVDQAVEAAEVLAGRFAEILFGEVIGQRIVPVFIALAAYGAVSAMVFSASRVIFVAARAGYLPFKDTLGSVSKRWKTPVWALLINLFWTCVLLIAPPPGEVFGFLVDLVGYPTWVNMFFVTIQTLTDLCSSFMASLSLVLSSSDIPNQILSAPSKSG